MESFDGAVNSVVNMAVDEKVSVRSEMGRSVERRVRRSGGALGRLVVVGVLGRTIGLA